MELIGPIISCLRLFAFAGALSLTTVALPVVADIYAAQLATPPHITSRNNADPAPGVPDKYGLIARLAHTASTTEHRALWVIYPASIRGRVFGGTGEDPFTSQSSGGW